MAGYTVQHHTVRAFRAIYFGYAYSLDWHTLERGPTQDKHGHGKAGRGSQETKITFPMHEGGYKAFICINNKH